MNTDKVAKEVASELQDLYGLHGIATLWDCSVFISRFGKDEDMDRVGLEPIYSDG